MTVGGIGASPRVSYTHSADRDLPDEDVLRLVRAALEPLGGMRRFVRPGQTVLLKPNQTLFFLATDGVTTDPRVVAALVVLAREAGARRIVVGDAAGGDTRSARVLEITGVERLAMQAGADAVVGFEDLPHRDVVLETSDGTIAVPVPAELLDADVVINVPKAKTHFEDRITCCLKNWVGVIGQEARPRIMDEPLLFEVVARLYDRVPAQLCVVDGLWAGEGDGPVANEARWLGCVVAGRDPVAVDETVADLMGLAHMPARFIEAAEALGVGTRRDVELVGPSLADVRVPMRPTRPGFAHLPVRVLVGQGVTMAGSAGHLKSILDAFHRFGVLTVMREVYGDLSFMVGQVTDPEFDTYVERGPYFVIDDVALAAYRNDPRVTVVPGHPATHNIFPVLFDRLRVERVGPGAFALAEVWKHVQGYFHFRAWHARGAAEGETPK